MKRRNDCKFHVGDVVTSRLSNGRAGITKVLQMDISPDMLQRDQALAQVLLHTLFAACILCLLTHQFVMSH